MKKILIAISILLMSINISHSRNSTTGKGELKLSQETINHFIDYLKGGIGKEGQSLNNKPVAFLVTVDGNGSYFWYCPWGECAQSSKKEMTYICADAYNQDCFFFALRRVVKWKNGINPGKGKKSKFSSKMSRNEVIAKLDELGFIGDNINVVNDNKKQNKDQNKEVVKQLKELNDLFKSGILTKEEFESAKKKLLN